MMMETRIKNRSRIWFRGFKPSKTIEYSLDNLLDTLSPKLVFREELHSLELVQIINQSDDATLRMQAWEVIKETFHTRPVYSEILHKCIDELIIVEAWKLYQEETPTQAELIRLICNAKNQNTKTLAWPYLQKLNPGKKDLVEMIKSCNNTELASALSGQLQIEVGFENKRIDQDRLIYDIARIVVPNPDKLSLFRWHDGEQHSLAGWVCKLNRTARRIERKENTEVAGYIAIPKLAHLFYAKTKDEILCELTPIINQSYEIN